MRASAGRERVAKGVGKMDALVIHAASRESAEGFYAALTELRAKLVETPGGRYQVEIPLGGSNAEIVAALNALEKYVSQRGDGPARVELDGNRYTLHPAGPSPS